MTIVGAVLGAALGILQIILVARIVLDWAVILAGPPAYGSLRAKLTSVIYRLTEPLLAPVRRFIPPLRMGGVAIDLSFIVVLVVISILRSFVTRL
jgi:YggT family protein